MPLIGGTLRRQGLEHYPVRQDRRAFRFSGDERPAYAETGQPGGAERRADRGSLRPVQGQSDRAGDQARPEPAPGAAADERDLVDRGAGRTPLITGFARKST